MKIRQTMTRILDRERARRRAERLAFQVSETLDRTKAELESFRTANAMMAKDLREQTERANRLQSQLDDQWRAYEIAKRERDYFRSMANRSERSAA